MYAFPEAFVLAKKASSMSKINSVVKWVHHFNHVRAELKRDVKKNLEYLQRDRFAYVRELFDRIEEVRYTQKRLWKMIEDNPDKPILQKSYLSELHQSTLTLCNLYDALPAAIAVRPDFVNGGYDNGSIYGIDRL